jgi:hypothetical protein
MKVFILFINGLFNDAINGENHIQLNFTILVEQNHHGLVSGTILEFVWGETIWLKSR